MEVPTRTCRTRQMPNFTFCHRSAINLACSRDLRALSLLFPLPPDFVIKYEWSRRWQGDADLRGWAARTEPVLQLQIYARPILSQHFFFLLFWRGYVVAHNSFDLHLWRQSSIPGHTSLSLTVMHVCIRVSGGIGPVIPVPFKESRSHKGGGVWLTPGCYLPFLFETIKQLIDKVKFISLFGAFGIFSRTNVSCTSLMTL